MRLFKLINFLILSFFLIGIAEAKEIKVEVKLTDIKAIKTEEKGGDELYFDTIEYSSLGHSKEARIPAKPLHWLSSQLSGVKNVVLWQGTVQDDESIRVILTLVEQDLEPWEVDDMLGSIQLNLANKSGKLTKEWIVPVFEETDEVEMLKKGDPQRYLFKGDGAKYEVAFKVDQK